MANKAAHELAVAREAERLRSEALELAREQVVTAAVEYRASFRGTGITSSGQDACQRRLFAAVDALQERQQ
jgi:hypothetical protein